MSIHYLSKKLMSLFTAILFALSLAVPALAGNPDTGDNSGLLLVVMGALLLISVVLIVVYAVMSAKKRKK